MPHPYGQERWADGVAVTDFGFTSQRIERGFGLMDYQARYYSPTLGRFISPDTIVPEPGSSGGYNRYRYTRNNPLKYTDPTGHCSSLSGAAWSVCASVVTTVAPAVHKANEFREDIFFPDASTTTADRVIAATAVGGGPVAAIGGAMIAPMAVPYVYSGAAAWTSFSAAYPLAAGAVGGIAETAFECSLNGGCGAGDYAMGAVTGGLANAGNGVKGSCSFSYDTLVLTRRGLRPIGSLAIDDEVWAYDEASGEMGWYPVTAVWAEEHRIVVHLTIAGELIKTTREHPFKTAEGVYVAAGRLQVGDRIYRADGTVGTVEAIGFLSAPQVMYNLTVAKAHTYFVGDGSWLVHNTCPDLPEFDGTTRGILITNEGASYPVSSGARDPRFPKTASAGHAEGRAALVIRDTGSSGGTIYHNNPHGTCPFCHGQLRTLLPEGATLNVVPPTNTIPRRNWQGGLTSYTGLPDDPDMGKQLPLWEWE